MVELTKARATFMVVSIGTLYIIWGLLISLQPSFYPTEAEKKGATPSQYGLVFGISNLAAFLTAPIVGRFGSQIGPKYLYNTGAFVQAIAGLSFGFLDKIENVNAFLGLSYFLRFLTGMADAFCWGSVVSILMKIFPKHVTTIASWTEMLFGLGYMIGPALGSALYSVGGFTLPYIVVASMAFVMAVVLAFVVPKVKTNDKEDGDVKTKTLTFSSLVQNPSIFTPFFDNFVCFAGSGMIESMLEPHMKNEAGSTQMDVGLAFLILGGLYMTMSVTAGFICDKIKYPTIVSIIGNSLMVLGFLLVGPAPFITTLLPTTGLIQGSTAILGAGYAMVMVSTFGRSQAAAIRHGYNDDLDTYMFISSMWSFSFFFGNFLGPTLSGIAVDSYGFRSTSLFFFVAFCFMTIVDFLELGYTINANKKRSKAGYEIMK